MGPQDPRLSSPAERERSAAKDKGTGGGQYVAVCSVSNSPLTHNPFATISQPFRIKCERYFSKEVCSLVIIVLTMFPHVYVYNSYICILNMLHSLFTKPMSAISSTPKLYNMKVTVILSCSCSAAFLIL